MGTSGSQGEESLRQGIAPGNRRNLRNQRLQRNPRADGENGAAGIQNQIRTDQGQPGAPVDPRVRGPR
ncbi:MAG: hypothetical protein ACAI38_01360 [Myxococcota bacterium]